MIINLVSDLRIKRQPRIDRNLALQKVKLFHVGCKFIENDLTAIGKPDVMTYISILFRSSRSKYEPYANLPNTMIGGSGWDLITVLPPEIDDLKPHMNYGFTQRGCNRKCSFCIVPEKEGKYRVVGNLKDLWDGTPKAEIMIWDNNVLFDLEHTKALVEESKELGVRLDWNQGMDFRLLTQDVVDLLKPVKLFRNGKWRFSLDNPADIQRFKDKLPLMRQLSSTPFVYVYVDASDPDGELERLSFLREEKCKPSLQLDDCVRGLEKYQVMRDYCNGINGHFMKLTWDEYYPIRQERENRMIKQNRGYLKEVKIKDIIIGENRRPVGDVTNLKNGIESYGYTCPISITKDMKLVYGAHRIEACKQLGWETIPAMIFDFITPEHAEMAEIDENLHRVELTKLEICELSARRKVLYEKVHPESSKASITTGNLSQKSGTTNAFTKDIAEKKGCSRRVIEKDVQIGENLVKETCDVIRNTPLANNKSELLVLARKTAEEQAEFCSMLKAGLVKNASSFHSIQSRANADNQPVPEEPVEGIDFQLSAKLLLGKYQEYITDIPDGSVQLFLTDPPYGCGVRYGQGSKTEADFIDVIEFMKEVNRMTAHNGSALIFCSEVYLGTYLTNTFDLKLVQIMHWYKTNKDPKPLEGNTGLNKYLDSVEYILWFVKDYENYTFNSMSIDKEVAGSKRTTRFESDDFSTGQCAGGERYKADPNANDKIKAFHRCQKPVDLIESLLLAHSNRGDMVVDLFSGTGTTAEVAVSWERSFFGTEMNPEFHALAEKRMAYFIGKNEYILEDEEYSDEWDEYYDNDEVIRGEYEPEINEELKEKITEEMLTELKAEMKAEMKAKYILSMAQMQEKCEAGTAPEALQAQYQAHIDAGFTSENFMAKVESI